MATRARKSAAPKASTNTLLLALEFIALAQKNVGTHSQTHCIVRDGWCVASDNVLTMGCKVPDNLGACPQTARLIAALRRCSDSVVITQVDSDRISVKSGSLRVVVPCVGIDQMAATWADPLIAPLGEPFRDACRAIGHLATDGGSAVHLASLLGRGQYLAATSGRVMAEYWHGFETPPYWVLPKPSVTALLKVDKPLVGLGFSGRSATFHFQDESWLKTQLFADKWPNVDKLFESDITPTPVPETLFASVAVIADFAVAGAHIVFKNESIELAMQSKSEHAEHEVKGLREGAAFNLKDLQQVTPIAKTLDYVGQKKAAYFTGERLRGAISMVAQYDDDIPF